MGTRHVLTDYDPPPLSYVQYTKNGKYLLVASLDDSLGLWSAEVAKHLPLKQYPASRVRAGGHDAGTGG